MFSALPFIGPWLIGFALLTVYPFLASLYWSFCRYDLLSDPQWVGGENYGRLAHDLWQGGPFGLALWNTAYYVLVSVPLSIALGVGLAVMLSCKVRGIAIYRTLLFLPSVVPVVAAAILWMWILDPAHGILNHLLSDWVGLPPQAWFQSTSEAFWPPSWIGSDPVQIFGSKDGLVLMSLWGVGNFMIIYLAALGDIPTTLYEAARLDGAGPLRRFFHVTLPLLTPVIFFNLVLGTIQATQAFTQVYLVSDGQGDPAGSTLLLSLFMFLAAFRDLDIGYASAMAWILFILVLLVTLGLFRSAHHWVHYQGVGRRAAVIGLLVSVLGCAPPQTEDDRSEVIFWHFWGGRDRPVVQQIVDQFNASQPHYFVRPIAMPGNNLDLKFFLSVAGGDPPDLVNQDDPIVADWAHRGALLPLAELATPEELVELRSWLFPAALRLASYQGCLYAMPNGLDIRALYYNKTLLEEYGLSPPGTLADLDAIAVTIAPPQKSQRLDQVGYLPDPRRLWAWGPVFGGKFANLTASHPEATITADQPAILRALEWMASYRDHYGTGRVTAFRSGDQALTGTLFPLLANRRYAVIMDGQWRVRDIFEARQLAASNGQPMDEYGVVPLPPPPGGCHKAGWVNGNFFVVPRGAHNPDGAWEFMKFWSGFGGNEAAAARACAAGGWIPVSQSVVDQPLYQAYLKRMPLMDTFVELAGSDKQLPTPALPVAPFFYREVVGAAQDVMYRGAEPESRLHQAADRVRKQLQRTLGETPVSDGSSPGIGSD